MKLKNLLTASGLLLASLTASSQTTATSILKSSADKITASKTLTADFKISSGSTSESGSLTVDMKKFRYVTPRQVIIYNGTTQWSVDNEIKEINIYNPEPEEIDQINPFALITNYRSLYNARLLDSAAGTAVKVELTPKLRGESLQKAVLTINTTTKLPTTIAMTLSDGSTARIDISNVKTGTNISASKFVLDKGDYPRYEIIDLR